MKIAVKIKIIPLLFTVLLPTVDFGNLPITDSKLKRRKIGMYNMLVLKKNRKKLEQYLTKIT